MVVPDALGLLVELLTVEELLEAVLALVSPKARGALRVRDEVRVPAVAGEELAGSWGATLAAGPLCRALLALAVDMATDTESKSGVPPVRSLGVNVDQWLMVSVGKDGKRVACASRVEPRLAAHLHSRRRLSVLQIWIEMVPPGKAVGVHLLTTTTTTEHDIRESSIPSSLAKPESIHLNLPIPHSFRRNPPPAAATPSRSPSCPRRATRSKSPAPPPCAPAQSSRRCRAPS